MPGPKRKPTALKLLRSSASEAQKLIARETPTPGELQAPPEWFTPEQKTAWVYAIDNAPRRYLKRIDSTVLATFIIAQDIHRQAAIEVSKGGLVVLTPVQKIPAQNAYLSIMNRQALVMLRAANDLGFTPTARARIDAGKSEEPVASRWDDIAIAD